MPDGDDKQVYYEVVETVVRDGEEKPKEHRTKVVDYDTAAHVVRGILASCGLNGHNFDNLKTTVGIRIDKVIVERKTVFCEDLPWVDK